MAFKDLPYWLKGGIIALIIVICSIPLGWSPLGSITGILLFLPVHLVNLVAGPEYIQSLAAEGTFSNSTAIIFMIAVIISPIIWFVIGSIIGHIYGKTKQKKK